MVIKILLTITLALTFVFLVLFSIYVYCRNHKTNSNEELDALMSVCALLFIVGILFWCSTLAGWLVWR